MPFSTAGTPVLLWHLPCLLERGLLHVECGVGEAWGIEGPAYVVGVEVREDDVGHVIGGVACLVEMVEQVIVPSQLVATLKDLGQLWSETRVDEHEVIAGLDQHGVHGAFDAGLPGAAEEVARVRDEYPVIKDVDPHLPHFEGCPGSQVAEPSSRRKSE
jgi:hypothetical protein